MAKAKRYTAEQLSDAEKMAATLANVPEEKRTLVIMMTNSFMAGMEAQKAITDTVEGTGVLGEIEDPVTGQFASATIKIPFAVLYSDMFSIVNTTEPPLLTLRGSMQCTDPKTGATGYYPIRVVVRGKAKTTTLGKVAKGKKMESEVELEILYIKVEINNAVVLELDKLNFVFVLNGKDMLAQIRSQC